MRSVAGALIVTVALVAPSVARAEPDGAVELGAAVVDAAAEVADRSRDEPAPAPDRVEAAVPAHAPEGPARRERGTERAGGAHADAGAATPVDLPRADRADGDAGRAVAPVPADVKVGDRVVYTVRAAAEGAAPAVRARAVASAIEAAIAGAAGAEEPEVRPVPAGDGVAVVVGAAVVLRLREEDARASGEPDLLAHAANVAADVREAVRAERRRAALSARVYELSLAVFSGLLVVLVLQRLLAMGRVAQRWLRAYPERVPAVRLRDLELMSPAAARRVVWAAIALLRFIVPLAVVYGWLLFALSLFEATRAYGARLSRFFLEPLSQLLGRLAGAVPLLVVLACAGLLLLLVLRAVRLYFVGVARGDARMEGVAPEHAGAVGFLVSVVAVVAFVAALPVVMGDQGAFAARLAFAVLVALALAVAPILASAAVGLTTILGGRVRRGDEALVAGERGRVVAVTLTEIRLEGEEGEEVRVPHLLALVRSVRVALHDRIEVVAEAAPARVPELRGILERAARESSPGARVELRAIEDGCARLLVHLPRQLEVDRTTLLAALAAAIAEAGFAARRVARLGARG